MVLKKFYDGIEIHRREKIIIINFLKPHRVISTCRANGGLREDLNVIFNHQSCEPSGHRRKIHDLAITNPELYLQRICEYHRISNSCASLGTAANMNCASIVSKSFKDLEVVTVCTGGVETNAGRAGDPASVYEEDGRFIPVNGTLKTDPNQTSEESGTINIILCINRELTAGALVRSVVTATEAKTAVLQELGIGSKYSNKLATGTGTDQIAIACVIEKGKKPLTGAGKHTKLGELIGTSVKEAMAETLRLQNGLCPESRCSSLVHIRRFGATKKSMIEETGKYLDKDTRKLFEKNFTAIETDPVTVASVAALVHIKDKFEWRVLPKGCAPEVLSTYGAHVAVSVSGKYHHFIDYKNILDGRKLSPDDKDFLELVYFCFALGFMDKWRES